MIETMSSKDDTTDTTNLPAMLPRHDSKTTFLTLPFELREQVLKEVLPFEHCRYASEGGARELNVVKDRATNIVVACPALSDDIVSILLAHLLRRKQEWEEYTQQRDLREEERAGEETCYCIRLIDEWDEDRDGLCAWCQQHASLEECFERLAGQPEASVSFIRELISSVKMLGGDVQAKKRHRQH
jgi:hypothetical protein